MGGFLLSYFYMLDQTELFQLLTAGNIDGFSAPPKVIETVISRIFIFEAEKTVLKFYKRDNIWWNKDMRDLSGGKTRRQFIERDFGFNHALSPAIYEALKTPVVEDGKIFLRDFHGDEDELAIVMHQIDTSKTLTHLLNGQSLTREEYLNLGKEFARAKRSLPRDFLSGLETDWYAQMRARLDDLSVWMVSAPEFPQDIGQAGLSTLKNALESYRETFRLMHGNQLSVTMDCNTENLLFEDGKLSFFDAYPPRREWLDGMFEVDIFRVGSSIYALDGEKAYEAYLEGARQEAGNNIDMQYESFYLLYGILISAPYFYMLSKNDVSYLPKAERCLAFAQKMIEKMV